MESSQNNTYDLFTGKDLEVAELIQQRRLQMLIHSYLYYKSSSPIITDHQWDEWAKELKTLQQEYPNISKQVIWYEAFSDWDGTTGEFLPLDDEWVIQKSMSLIRNKNKDKRK